MTQVVWSQDVLLYGGSSLLTHLLGDLRPSADADAGEGPTRYVAVQLDPRHWLVERATTLRQRLPFAQLDVACEQSHYTARLDEVTDILMQHMPAAAVFRAGTTPATLAEVAAARYAVVLDDDDSAVWVGERDPGAMPRWPAPPAESASPIAPIPRSAPPPQAVPEAAAPDHALAGAEPQPDAPIAPGSARYLQGDLLRRDSSGWVTAEARLVRREAYRLDVFIGPPGIGAVQASAAFRDDLLDWKKKDVYRLQVVFNEIGVIGEAQTGWIDLTRRGMSSICSFEFVPQATALFKGRISVLHEGRVLQTAVIQADVVDSVAAAGAASSAGLHPQVEMIVHHDLSSLDERRRFDVSLILNHAVDGSAAMTAASRQGAYVSSLDDLQAQLAAISELLVELANNSKRHTKGLTVKENASWLGRLAAEGNFLYRKLVLDYIGQSPTADALRAARTMQIVSARPDAVVPLEFVYAYPPPKQDAPVCPNAAKALEQGECPAQCRPAASPASCVCPMGFWGLDRVIERHVHDPRLGVPAAISGSEPAAGRKTLDTHGMALLAVSEQVPKSEQKALSERITKVWKGGVSIAPDWASWPGEVKTRRPALFVVLPHTSGKGARIAMEIQGDTQECRYIDRSYVCPDGAASPPIVLLLGCDTASAADKDAYTSNIAVFRQAGSAIVVATTAALVWGTDAAKVAGVIMDALGTAIGDTSDCFGDVLLAAKRRAVRDSQLMAMSLAAFGDADWRFKD
jgi:hypothetical protein